MTISHFDFVVAGSSAEAALLAISLAKNCGTKVCLLGRFPSPYQLARNLVLSVGPYSRPETWRMLSAGQAETLELLNLLEGPVTCGADVVFSARSARQQAALGHIRHMMTAVGHITTPLAQAEDGYRGISVAGAVRLRTRRFYAALGPVLNELGIAHFDTLQSNLQIGRDHVQFEIDGAEQTADLLIGCDDGAGPILDTLPGLSGLTERPNLIGLATGPSPMPANSLIYDLDEAGFVLAHDGGSLECASRFSERTRAEAWLAGHLPRKTCVTVNACGQFASITSRDGAPVAGRIAHQAAGVAFGFGLGGIFLMPALARFFARGSTEHERAYFAARAPDAARASIAEIGALYPESRT